MFIACVGSVHLLFWAWGSCCFRLCWVFIVDLVVLVLLAFIAVLVACGLLVCLVFWLV